MNNAHRRSNSGCCGGCDAARQTSHPVPARGAIAAFGPALYGTGAGEWRLSARRVGPVAQWLEPTAHNGLVGGSSPPGPTTHSFEPRDFPDTCKWAAIGGLRRWRFVSAETNFTRSGISGELSLWSEFTVPGGRIGKIGIVSGNVDLEAEH